jgi:hypothetical protein
MTTVEEFKQLNAWRASILHVGGLRPTGDPIASNFGLLPLGLANEPWPAMNEKAMLFVCQMNLTAAPEVPALLQDIKVITFFVKGSASALKKENGKSWCLRAYKSLDGLAPLARPEKAPSVKRGFECRWEACDDYPNHDDPGRIVPDGFDASEVELDNVARTKIGGYASSIQSEPWWAIRSIPPIQRFAFRSTVRRRQDWRGATAEPSTWLGEPRTDARTTGSSTGSVAKACCARTPVAALLFL